MFFGICVVDEDDEDFIRCCNLRLDLSTCEPEGADGLPRAKHDSTSTCTSTGNPTSPPKKNKNPNAKNQKQR